MACCLSRFIPEFLEKPGLASTGRFPVPWAIKNLSKLNTYEAYEEHWLRR